MHTFARQRARASVRRRAVLLLCAALLPSSASAQERLAIRSDFLFYGDNTEFRNPFREGETIFGAAVRVTAEVGLNDRVTISVGGFGNQRFGSEDAFEQVRPVLALTVRGRRSSFVLGHAAAAHERKSRSDRTGMALTSCSRRSSARRSRSTGRTKPGSPGRSAAATCSIISGSNGSDSTRPIIGSGSTAGCARHIASQTS